MHLQENSVGLSAQVQGPREEWELAGDRREKGGGGGPGLGVQCGVSVRHCRASG